MNEMREEYDFAQGTRGKFFSPDALFNLPVYLESDLFAQLAEMAKSERIELNRFVNQLLKEAIRNTKK